jgi:fluoroquinolone transport system permease protein
MKQLIKLSVSDFKIIFRDLSLRVFLFMPIFIFLVINYFLPFLIIKFPVFEDYVIYVIIVATIELVQMFGFIYSMVLIDEKETEVAKIYGVLPVSKFWFIIFRLIIPMIITAILTWLILMVQPFYDLSPFSLVIFAALTGLTVPVYVIGIVNMCKNRMEGMVWIKVFNVIVLIPIAAFFIPDTLQKLIGVFTTHRVFQSMYSIINAEIYQWQIILGMLYFIVLLYILARKFSVKHFA